MESMSKLLIPKKYPSPNNINNKNTSYPKKILIKNYNIKMQVDILPNGWKRRIKSTKNMLGWMNWNIFGQIVRLLRL